jgi:hypothetical protein
MDPTRAFSQVAHLVKLLKAGGICLELAVQVLQQLGIHPWSLLGGYGEWEEVQRDWGLRLGLPAAWLEAQGPRDEPEPADGTRNHSPNAFRIPIDLDLEHLPAGLKLKNLEVRHCPRLERIQPGLAIRENLSFHACGRLETIPRDLEVGGRLSITSCSSLRDVCLDSPPREVVLADDMDLREVRLPAAFKGSLGLKRCVSLETLNLPSGILENLYLDGCDGLGPLPVRQVRKGLWLGVYDGGTTCLRPGVQVDGSVWLRVIEKGPARFSAGLRIGSDLILDLLATSGVDLPPETQVGGSVYLPRGWHFAPGTLFIPAHLRVVAYAGYSELPDRHFWEEG